MATLKDVAEKAGVSVSTVSRVYSGTAFVEEATKAKVLEVAKQLNYHPNAVGRFLKKRQTKNIGVLIPDIRNPIFPILVRAMEDKAESKGYTICLCNTDENPVREEQYMRLLQSVWVDGIVVATGGLSDKWNDIEGFFGRKIPVVSLMREVNAQMDLVAVDNKGAMNMAIDHLFSRGHKKIMFCKGKEDILAYQERWSTYKDRMMSLGMFDEKRVVEVIAYQSYTANQMDAYTKVKEYLKKGIDTDAIIAANDTVAMNCIRAVTEMNLRIPEDIAIIGFDNVDISCMTTPPLTAISQPFYEMGEKAIELLIGRIEAERSVQMVQTIRFASDLVVRQTT